MISGYYGFDNPGDELILKAIIENLRALDPSLDITVISKNPWRTVNLHPSIMAVNRWNIWGIARELLRCQLFISGGGGLLQDATGQGSVIYYLGWGYIAKKIFRKKVMLYAQGIGPLNKDLSRFLVRWWINSMDLITLREERSLLLLRDLGVYESKVKITADPVLGLTPRLVVTPREKSKLSIGLVLRQDSDKLRSVKTWCDILIAINNAHNVKLCLLPFQHPHDVRLSQAIKENMKTKVELKVWQDLNDIISFYDDVDAIVSMRLHALILSVVCGKPMLGLNYDPKIDNFMALFGQSAIPRERIVKNLDRIVVGRNALVQEQNAILEKLKVKARENAALAMALIKKESYVQ